MTDDLPQPLICETDRPLILVGNGEYDIDHLARFDRAGPVVAVDGGYYGCRLAGIQPDLVIGDMDSIDGADLAAMRGRTEIHALSEQDTTDLEKALRHLRAPVFVGFGFLGGRLDHSLAALTVLSRYAASHKVILIASDDVVHVTASAFCMPVKPDSRVSVWPLGPIMFDSSTGLHWPLDGLSMAPGTYAGTSNRATEARFSITPQAGNRTAYAVLVEQSFTEDMLTALMIS